LLSIKVDEGPYRVIENFQVTGFLHSKVASLKVIREQKLVHDLSLVKRRAPYRDEADE
jgi:hypothetical protein